MIYAVNKRTKEHRVMSCWAPDWDLVEADADGWIKWSGGECPLPYGVKYDVRCASGSEGRQRNPEEDNWLHVHGDSNIIAYRPILDAKPEPEPEAPEWDGETWPPPVGTRCLARNPNTEDGRFEKATVIHHSRKGAVVVEYDHGDIEILSAPGEFRPIRTDREQWVDRALYLVTPIPGPQMLAEAIYDALASGELDMPEVWE